MARTMLFLGAAGVVLAGAVLLALRLQRSPRRLASLALVVGGGLSNWIDRAIHGSVVDFMNVGFGGLRTGIFNVADVAIVAGAAILLFSEFRKSKKPRIQ